MKTGNRFFSSTLSDVAAWARPGSLTSLILSGLIFSSAVLSSVFAISADAASAVPARNLVTASVDTNQRHVLAGQHALWATSQNDAGAVANDLPLPQLTIELKRTPEREQAFQQLLKDQQDPASPDYHHWLTPVEVGEQFGASQPDIDAVSDWLSTQGLHVDSVANSRTRIVFSGAAATVANALATSMHYYQVGGETRIANAGDPQIPAALANIVQSVHGLYVSRQRPQNLMVPRPQSALKASSERPEETYCPSGGTCQYTIFPADFAKIYGASSLTAQGITGSGQTIAIVGKARVYNTDLTNFEQFAGVTFAAPTVIVPPGGSDPGAPATTCSMANPDTCDNPTDAVGNQSEATLDVERAGSVAPGAAITLIVSADINSSSGTLLADGSALATNYAIDTNPVPARILSISFGSCESANGSAGTEAENQLFQQAAAEGISVFVASGDAGAAGCEGGTSTPGANQTLSINAICSSGSVTCVGGTEFADSADPSAYWAASDSTNYLSALGYIPEGAWNDPLDANGSPQFSASGGGVSVYIPTPSWQTGTGVPGTQGRYTPDVSFAASINVPYFACFAAGGGSCVVGSNDEFNFIAAGGTSASTPSMAGITALLNQKIGSAQGNLNPRLYSLATNSANGVFHDVTAASSSVSNCALSTPSLCNNSTPGASGLSGGLAGYAVGTGYDEVTGLGSINVANLLAQWSSAGTGSVPVNLDQHGLTGSWYNPATSGQGIEMEVYPDLVAPGQGLLFAGWFTFDVTAAGGKRWYALSGNVSNTSSSAQLTIGAVDGGNFNALPAVGATAVGQATLQFSDCNDASLTYTFTDGSGRSGTIPLARLTTNITCGASGTNNGTAPSDYLLSGDWYDPSTSGQGLIFDINPAQSLLFAAWYTFLPDGQQTGGGASQSWYTIVTGAGPFTAGLTSLNNIPIGETTGGIFNNPATATTVQVGSANIAFQSCNAMTLTYTFTGGTNQGQHGTINLVRTGPTPEGCSL